MFMCFLLLEGSSNERDIIRIEETFAYVGWDVGIPGQFAVASDVNASKSYFSIGRISESGAIDFEYSASHRVGPESKGGSFAELFKRSQVCRLACCVTMHLVSVVR